MKTSVLWVYDANDIGLPNSQVFEAGMTLSINQSIKEQVCGTCTYRSLDMFLRALVYFG